VGSVEPRLGEWCFLRELERERFDSCFFFVFFGEREQEELL
jgi:hypothetical protein